MNNFRVCTIIIIASFGWSLSIAQDAPSEKGKRAFFHPEKTVDWYTFSGNYSVKIKEGDEVVFEVISETGIDERNDSMIKSVLYFSVSENKEAFNFENGEFGAINAFLRRHCRCLDAGFNKVKSGYIKGQKRSDGKWELDIAITAIGNNLKNEYPLEFKGIASLE